MTAVRSLHSRRGRTKSGDFVVEGPQSVSAAIGAGVAIRHLYVLESDVDWMRRAQESGLPWSPVTDSAMAAMAETQQPQGVLAICGLLPSASLDAIMAAAGPVLVLESLSDPGNVGTAIRTADAVGAAGVVLVGDCADVHNGKVVRATAGSLFHIPIALDATIDEVAAAAAAASRTLAVATGDAAVDLFTAVGTGLAGERCVWVVGSEAHGVSAAARSRADACISIPITGAAESLNAAVAASIVLYVTRHGGGMATPS